MTEVTDTEMKRKRPLFTRILEEIPQTLCLGSGIHIHTRSRRDNRKVWDIFTSSEYMSIVPQLVPLNFGEVTLIDCGAGTGLFSLFIEHLSRVNVLEWGDINYVMIEPSQYNYELLERNISYNLEAGTYDLRKGLVGKKQGNSKFYEHRKKPYSSSVLDRKDIKVRKNISEIPFLDVTGYLNSTNPFIKLDIEGSEFMFLESYMSDLSGLCGLIIEWHSEMGDVDKGNSILESSGLKRVKRSWDKETRFVDLYLPE